MAWGSLLGLFYLVIDDEDGSQKGWGCPRNHPFLRFRGPPHIIENVVEVNGLLLSEIRCSQCGFVDVRILIHNPDFAAVHHLLAVVPDLDAASFVF